MKHAFAASTFAFALAMAAATSTAQNVKITPVGSHPGEPFSPVRRTRPGP